MAINLEEELRSAGYAGEVDSYRKLVLETFSQHCPNWTDEELLFHPSAAIRFCGAVVQQSGVALSDHIILRTLVNCRKHSRSKDAMN